VFFVEYARELRTVVPLGNAVLDPSPLSEVRDLGPVFIWIGGATESAAGTVGSDMSRRRRGRVRVVLW
jgi:hypothetical protein